MHVLKEYMGHSKITTTQEYYLAAETEDAEKAKSALDLFLSGASVQSQSGRNPDAIEGLEAKSAESKNDGSPCETGTSENEADGTRTRNHRIDSPVL